MRLHRARLFVRKELAKQNQHRVLRETAKPSGEMRLSAQPRQRRCKEMFAELSNYLDDELDDSLCEELEKHLDGCEPCKAFLSSLERSIQQCRTAPNESPDPRVAARLRREVMTEYQGLMSKITRRDASEISQS
jgi:RNA polymerase sigma-70 factor (ECF subfamily)